MEDQLRHLILCTMCNKEFTDLKLLPCQHLACIGCLRERIGSNKDKFICNKCKAEILVPNGRADGFPDSLMTRQVADILKSASKPETVAGGETKPEPKPSPFPTEEDPLSVKVKEIMADKKKKLELREALEEKSGRAQEWLFITQANEKMVSDSLEALPNQVKEAKQQIQEIRNTERARLQKKIDAINAAAAKKLDSIQKTRSQRETELNNFGQQIPPKLHLVRESLADVQKLVKSLTAKQVTQDSVRKAIKKLEALTSLDVFGGILDWKKLHELSSGDSVRFDIGEHVIKRVEEILDDDIDFMKVGRIMDVKKQMGMYFIRVMFPDEKNAWQGQAKYITQSLEESTVPFANSRVIIATPPESASFVHTVDLENAKQWHKDKAEGVVGRLVISERVGLEGRQHEVFAAVVFPGMKTWYGPIHHLKKTESLVYQVGMEVMLRREIERKDGATRSCVGVVKSATGDRYLDEVVVDFPSKQGWTGNILDITPARHPIENDSVAAKLDTDLSESKWKGVRRDQVGKVVRIRYDTATGVGKGMATVQFGGTMVDCSAEELDVMKDVDEEETSNGGIPFQDPQFQQAMRETMHNMFPFMTSN